MADALAAQEARLVAKFEMDRGKALISDPIILVEGEPSHETDPETEKMKERLEMLEKSLATLKHQKEGVDPDSLSLFPKARLPPKFHMPSMDKFDRNHLSQNPLGLSNELLAQLFQQSLTGAALKWFMSLDLTKIKTWEDICSIFNA